MGRTENRPPGRARTRWPVLAPLAAAAVGTIFFAGWVVAGADPGAAAVNWVYNLTLLLAAAACFAAAVLHRELRWAWTAFGTGLAAWAAGDIYWVEALAGLETVPYPSWADAAFLAVLPCFFVGIGLLIRHRVGRFSVANWLDGAIAALGAAALGTAVLAPALIGLTDGDAAAVMTNLAYPLGDLLLIGFIAGALVVGGHRGARTLVLVGAGLSAWAAADLVYLLQEATSSYQEGWLDLLWPIGALLIGLAAADSTDVRRSPQPVRRPTMLLPAVFLLIAAAILVRDHFQSLHVAAVILAGATIAVAVLRLAMSVRENDVLLRRLHADAVTDALTGLHNRRRLIADLDRLVSVPGSPTHLFALFDLDGFKSYNDSFGHPAGDSLLLRLGERLRRTAAAEGRAYRLGGDEFCVLVELDSRAPVRAFEAARGALSEEGEGFSIGASGGWTTLPGDYADASEALREVDARMYEEKARRSTRATHQTHDVLVRMFRERDPLLSDHTAGVARLALEVGRRIGLDAEQLDAVGRGAELHDIGKIAIPEEILNKSGALEDDEWALMKRHTLIGARILGATPAMRPVAELVRSSHERWDGAGYPAGLAGEAIPLGSRIIFICDAFDAMISDRPYHRPISIADALDELRRCAGGQFDPALVPVFCELLERDGLEPVTGLVSAADPVAADRPAR